MTSFGKTIILERMFCVCVCSHRHFYDNLVHMRDIDGFSVYRKAACVATMPTHFVSQRTTIQQSILLRCLLRK